MLIGLVDLAGPVAAASPQDFVLSGPILAALLLALVAGLISFFSPCVLPLVPVYLSYVSGVAAGDARDLPRGSSAPSTSSGPAVLAPTRATGSRTVLGSVLFVLGFAVVFTSYGALFGQLGRSLNQYQEPLIRISGVLTIVMGLLFAGALSRFPGAGRTIKPRYRPQVGLAGAPLLGGLFAIGWTPCIGPTLAAVLTLSTTAATAERGALLTFVYSLGLGIPFLVAAVTVGRSSRIFTWIRRHHRVVTVTGGALLVVIGLMQVTGLWSSALAVLQGLLVGWQSPL